MAPMWTLIGLMAMAACCCGEAIPQRTDFTLTGDTENCGSSYRISSTAEYRLIGTGDTPVTNCKIDFTADVDGNCEGLCYMFNPTATFKSPKARLIVTSSGASTVYNSTNMVYKPVCSSDTQMTFNLQKDKDFEYNPEKNIIGYKFMLEIYNKCGPRGDIQGITFDEALRNIEGYHHGEDRESREKMNYVSGILLGFGLASIFLVVLLIAYCYVRNSPNRGPNRSVGMPKVGGFKKNLKPHKEPSAGTEMGVRYTATGEGKPENKPLLTVSTSSDPEKPPAETPAAAERR